MPRTNSADPLVISEVGQLRALSAMPTFTPTRPVVLKIDGLDEAEAFTIAEKLNRDRTDCGCSMGARVMTTGFLTALVVLAVLYGPFTLDLFVRLPIAVGVAFISAVAGKFAGILLAHRRARRDIERLETRFTSAA